MKSWTRTLNLDDAHTLLAISRPGMTRKQWEKVANKALGDSLSKARKNELTHLIRENFLDWEDGRLQANLFLAVYDQAPAEVQQELVDLHWALSHPISLVAADWLGTVLETGDPEVTLDQVDDLVAENLDTESKQSQRKTRTILLKALENVGVMDNMGTGRHRQLKASRGAPSPLAFTYVLLRELAESGPRNVDTLAAESWASRLTQCGVGHANRCIGWAIHANLVDQIDNDIKVVS